MRKKILALFVIAIMLAFVGCGSVPVDAYLEQVQDYAKEQVEQKATNLWGIIIGCDHEPNNYVAKKNMVFCKCGANEFSDLSYKDFFDCVDFWDTGLKNKEKYCIKAYVGYKGVNPIYLEFAEMLPKNKQKDDALDAKLELLGTWVEKSGEILDGTLIIAEKKNDLEAIDLIQSTADFTGVLGNAIDITQKVVNLNKLLDNDGDPQALCDNFIAFVNGITPPGNGVFTMQLDALSEGLNIYWKYYDMHEYQIEVYLLDHEINGPVAAWGMFNKPDEWVGLLKDVENLDAVYAGNLKITGNKLLPSVAEVCKAIQDNTLEDKAKQLATEYIMFRINYYLEKQMGITLDEYIEALEELAQEMNAN